MKGKYGRITNDIQTVDCMLHKMTKVFVEDIQCTCTHGEKNIKVKDNTAFVRGVKELQAALGDGEKVVTETEKPIRKKLRK